MINSFKFIDCNTAEIVTNLNIYRVNWKEYGWGWAVVVIKTRKALLFGILNRWLKVSSIDGKSLATLSAEKQLPNERKQWFIKAVESYETRLQAWNKE